MSDTYADPEHTVTTPAIEMRFEDREVTRDLFADGLTLWGAPLAGYASRLDDVLVQLEALPWYVWPATIAVRQISLSTQPAPGESPPETVWARVSILGFGFEPGVPVNTKWNNAFGFPDNGVGANSVKLQSPVPNSHGRFAYDVVHKAVKRAAKDWLWAPNLQLVLVAQQSHPGGPILLQADQRYIPSHVLWQWVP
jgi:hypothetical protein